MLAGIEPGTMWFIINHVSNDNTSRLIRRDINFDETFDVYDKARGAVHS